MIQQEKAKELVNKYLQVYDGRLPIAKQCALIANNELLHYSKQHGFIELTKFHEEVEQEIINL